ncbi:MAG: hypothetical protein WBD06_01755, partial [Acidobacteriaceae bacterium]
SWASHNEGREAAAAADAADTRKNERREIMLAPVTNASARAAKTGLSKLGCKNVEEDYLIRLELWAGAARTADRPRRRRPSRNPHKHRDFHQNIPLAARPFCENIPSTEEQSSREESRKRLSRASATALTTLRETGGRMRAATKLSQRV